MKKKRNKSDFSLFIQKFSLIFAVQKGGLAQLARALAWHARGHGFDSHILHKNHRRHQFGVVYGFYGYVRCRTYDLKAPPLAKEGLGRNVEITPWGASAPWVRLPYSPQTRRPTKIGRLVCEELHFTHPFPSRGTTLECGAKLFEILSLSRTFRARNLRCCVKIDR